jgi:hypothetical protein
MKQRLADIFFDPRTVMWFGFAVFVVMAVGVLTGAIQPVG